MSLLSFGFALLDSQCPACTVCLERKRFLSHQHPTVCKAYLCGLVAKIRVGFPKVECVCHRDGCGGFRRGAGKQIC